jgi:hypothetical protein
MGKPHIRSVIPLVPRVYTEKEIHFNQWLASFIHGDGHFRVQNTYCRFQIEQATWNLHLLELLKKEFGGQIDKCKRYANTHLYGLSDKETLIELAHRVNGNVTKRATGDIFDWQISAKTDVLFALKYFEKGLKSNKLIRCKLISSFYELRDRKAYSLNSEFHNDRLKLIEEWYNNGSDQFRKECTLTPFVKKKN